MIFIVLPDFSTEDRLLAQARQGDRDAIMAIYESYFPAIYQFIRMRVEDSALAEDLTGDVFLKLIAAMQGPRAPHESLRGWLFKVARNVVYRHYGKSRRLPTTTLDEWLPDTSFETPEDTFIHMLSVDRSREAIRLLSPDQQEVIILRFGQMLNLEETADIMDKSVAAVKSLQYRAVNSLRDILKTMGVETANG